MQQKLADVTAAVTNITAKALGAICFFKHQKIFHADSMTPLKLHVKRQVRPLQNALTVFDYLNNL
jgi:hypothetical protein